mmetsp:Transcript_11170/g.29778  ORF Transcript_11170/g.29778 Transcript_11170/m.29778 type:complete len:217 (+) Transcript_11170:964-1614(+)
MLGDDVADGHCASEVHLVLVRRRHAIYDVLHPVASAIAVLLHEEPRRIFGVEVADLECAELRRDGELRNSVGQALLELVIACWPSKHLRAAHPGVEGPRDLARVDDAIRVKHGRHVGQRTLAHDKHIGTHHVCPRVQQGALVQVHPHAFQREHGKVLLGLRFLALRIPLHRAPQMDVCILHVRFAYALDHVEIEAVVDEASAIPLDASPHHVDRNG